jgi:superoxide dismutase
MRKRVMRCLRVISLQYQNRKAEYFKAIWDVINWKAAEKRLK